METIGISQKNTKLVNTSESTTQSKNSIEKINSNVKNVNTKAEPAESAKEPTKKPEISRVGFNVGNPQTSVRFTIAENGAENSEIKFQVVDKTTGEIIREFPKEDLIKQSELNGVAIKEGILIDSVG